MLVLATDSNPGNANWFPLVPTGSVLMWAGTGTPEGYLSCDGSSISRTSFPDLFAVLGTTYGSVDINSFSLPDLRGRAPIGSGTGSGLTNRPLGSSGGAETVTLGTGEIPAHTHSGTTDNAGLHSHTSNAVGGQGNAGLAIADGTNTATETDASLGEINVWTLPQALTINNGGDHNHTFTSGSTGGGGAHANMQPFLALNFIIKT